MTENVKDIESLKRLVWNRGFKVDGYPEDTVRKDACGALMVFEDYEDEGSIFGWRFDHIVPIVLLEKLDVPQDEFDNLRNLRPLNIANVISKGDDYPYYTSAFVADGTTNIERQSNKVVNAKIREELKKLYNLPSDL